jgi:dTDP-4-dehydrorhamnose 3,5-epimerase
MPSVKLIEPRRFEDERGWFVETYNQRTMTERGVANRFVQDNHSLSRPAGTVRGLHFQAPPHAQAKLVRCTAGSILDVAVDLRRGSPTYGRYLSAELSADNGRQLYVPIGYAHGFVTLEPNTEVCYKVSDFYAPDCDGGIRFDDPDLAIDWRLPPDGAVLSAKDAKLPALKDFDSPFEYDGVPLQPLNSK